MRNTSYTLFLASLLLLVVSLSACHKRMQVVSSSSEVIPINSDLDSLADSAYIASLIPLRNELQNQMGSVIGYCDVPMEVYEPECPMVNWMSDALLEEARAIYPGPVDVAIVNMGGARCSWAKGELTIGHVFELMPFDNELVILALKGQDLLELCQIFVQVGGEGIAGMRMRAEEGQLIDATIDGEPIKPDLTYCVATSDYLSSGKDKMLPLANHTQYWTDHQLIRDLYIENIKSHKHISAVVDGRVQL